MEHVEVIKIRKEAADRMNEWLKIVSYGEESLYDMTGLPEDTCIETYSCQFDDKMVADLKFCSGQTNFFLDPILFKPYNEWSFSEVQTLDCVDEIIDGDEYVFEYGDDTYVMKVEII